MERRRTPEETEDESSGRIERARERSAGPTTVDSRSLFERARAKAELGVVLVGVGALLVLFPEPVTSTVGLASIGLGVLVWLVGRDR